MNWKKSKMVIAICVISTLLAGSFTAYAQTSSTQQETVINITLNGESIDSDVNPYINDDSRTMVELRSIVEALGATLTWDADTSTVTITKGTSVFTLVIGELQYTLDGITNTIDTVATIVDSRTMVPARFVSEALGLEVSWDSSTNTVVIVSSDTDMPNNQGNGNMVSLESLFTPYVESGVITEAEMEALITYLEENEPEKTEPSDSQTEEKPDMLAGAVEDGIITQDQADSMDINIAPPAGGGQGMGSGPANNN
jgi:hypothetical protein